jgi:hypothetical protein
MVIGGNVGEFWFVGVKLEPKVNSFNYHNKTRDRLLTIIGEIRLSKEKVV